MSSLQENNEFCLFPQTLIVPQGEFYYTFWLNLQLF